MKTEANFIMFFIIIFCLISCNKAKNTKELLPGRWQLIKAIVSGTDSTDQFKINGCGCFITIDDEMDEGVVFSSCSSNSCGLSKEWTLDGNKNLNMQGHLVYPLPMSPHPSTPNVTYVTYLSHYIIILDETDLTLKVTHPTNSKEYVFEFKKL